MIGGAAQAPFVYESLTTFLGLRHGGRTGTELSTRVRLISGSTHCPSCNFRARGHIYDDTYGIQHSTAEYLPQAPSPSSNRCLHRTQNLSSTDIPVKQQHVGILITAVRA